MLESMKGLEHHLHLKHANARAIDRAPQSVQALKTSPDEEPEATRKPRSKGSQALLTHGRFRVQSVLGEVRDSNSSTTKENKGKEQSN